MAWCFANGCEPRQKIWDVLKLMDGGQDQSTTPPDAGGSGNVWLHGLSGWKDLDIVLDFNHTPNFVVPDRPWNSTFLSPAGVRIQP